MIEKKSKIITKRLSKGQRTHNRRVKQAARNDPFNINTKK
jgi:hypothetical protein